MFFQKKYTATPDAIKKSDVTEAIDYLLCKLHIGESMLRSLLWVTPETFSSFKNNHRKHPEVFRRLMMLYRFIQNAEESGVPEGILFNMLREPVNPSDEESVSPYYI